MSELLQLVRERDRPERNVADRHWPSHVNRRGASHAQRQPNSHACADQLHVEPPLFALVIVAHPERVHTLGLERRSKPLALVVPEAGP